MFFFQSERTLSFDILRTGGSVGEVTVQYRVLYLPAGVSDISEGTSGVVSPATGSTKLSEGVTRQNVTVSIFTNAFLDADSNLYVEITGTDLTSAGMSV